MARRSASLPAALLTAALVAGALPVRAQAGPPAAGVASIASCSPCAPVSEATLAMQRGGFDVGGGLRASFGIERAVFINGQLAAEQSIRIPDLGRITVEQAQGLQSILSGVTLVSNGPGNTPLQGTPAGGTTVIQNTLNDQTLRSLTVLNASTNSLQLLRNAAAAASLREALIRPLGPR